MEADYNFMPHGMCYLWQPGILWSHVVADAVIAIAYFTIAGVLAYILRARQDIPMRGIFSLFALFIFLCGTTHLFAVLVVWSAQYELFAVDKIVTAVVSMATAVVLLPKLPQVFALRSPSELERVNRQLAAEVEDRVKSERRLRESEARFRELAERMDEGLWVLSADGAQPEYLNPACRHLWGVAEEDVAPNSLRGHAIPEEDQARLQAAAARLRNGGSYDLTYRLRPKHGGEVWIREKGFPIKDETGNVVRLGGLCQDVTEEHLTNKELQRQARNDALTGIVNRRVLGERLEQALSEVNQSKDCRYVLCMLDVDGFRQINDELGHLAGDALLRQIANVLQGYMGPKELVARYGGDEFALLLFGVGEEDAAVRARQWLEAVSALSFSYESRVVKVSCSIGLVAISHIAHPTIQEAMRAADVACYKAKATGGGTVAMAERL